MDVSLLWLQDLKKHETDLFHARAKLARAKNKVGKAQVMQNKVGDGGDTLTRWRVRKLQTEGREGGGAEVVFMVLRRICFAELNV